MSTFFINGDIIDVNKLIDILKNLGVKISLSLIFVCLLLLWFPTKIISSMSPSKNIRKR